MKRIIRVYLFLLFISHFGIAIVFSTYVIFLQRHGLSLFEVNIVNIVYAISVFLFEVPTGAVADLYGRKNSFLVSSVFMFLGCLLYGLFDSMTGFIIAEILLAIGSTCASGSFEAWVVDELEKLGYGNDLKSLMSKSASTIHIAIISGVLFGGLLADILGLNILWFLSALFNLITLLLSYFLMKETVMYKSETKNTCLQITKKGYKQIKASKLLKAVIILDLILVFIIQAPNMQWQPLFSPLLGDSMFSLSLLFIALMVSALIGSTLVGLSKKLGGKIRLLKMVILYGSLLVIFTALFQDLYIMIIVFLAHELCRGLFVPIKFALIHENAESKQRATVVSLFNMIRSLGGAVGLFVFGYLTVFFSIRTVWVIAGLSAFILLFFYYLWDKNKNTV
ncbi:MAG: MFS transporter [Candidatus Magasanikbacteria bacterium]|nr:MFS transporter [Candidatus Magasanikbacteria bacterium]